ncbi:MAG: hypothetical protein ACOC9D_03455 [Thermodesulfobacteriota bacterium]
MIQENSSYAVITGDIVASSRLSDADRRRLYDVMKRGSAELRQTYPQAVPFEVDIFRGDSWQLLVSDVRQTLRIALFYRLFIKIQTRNASDSRESIGVGKILFVPETRVSEGAGPAYQISGKGLDSLKQARMCLRFEDNTDFESCADLLILVIDSLVTGLTDRQSLAVFGALRDWLQKDIVALWNPPISQQAVSDHLKSARWDLLKKSIGYIEDNMLQIYE